MIALLPDRVPIRIIIADPVERVRRAVRDLVELQPDMLVVGEAADGPTAADLVTALRPDVALLDAHMAGLGGVPIVSCVRHEAPAVSVVIYAANPGPEERHLALQAGAVAFVEKDVLPRDLLATLRQAGGLARGPAIH
jgi:DNA-binding NarL/FixJ family response regulator